MTRRGEFRLIADLFAPLSAGCAGAFGLTDDAAVVDVPAGRSLVSTVDALVEGVHFLPDDPPDLIARKLIRVNLSDLAAMGAAPWLVFLAACFPRDVSGAWLEGFAEGLKADCAEFGIALAGGDTVATPGPATFSLTALGLVPPGRALRRAGARPGDLLFLSGTLGDAALGLKVLRGEVTADAESAAFLADRYRLPQPRIGLGTRLAGLAHACLDISDGLVQDVGHLCRESGVGAVIDLAALPFSDAARAVFGPVALDAALRGGDDYELAFSAPPEASPRILEAAEDAGVPVAVIGRVEAGTGVGLLGPKGRIPEPDSGGWNHFRGDP
ncbi:MAG: thiamine-phosphate kinase [Alphaproteobacteria bacterium]|nr:thiamine-phosphate kinase [Alphaproteobacteria bacterium]